MLGSAKKKTDTLLLFFLGLTACIRGKRFVSSVSVDQIIKRLRFVRCVGRKTKYDVAVFSEVNQIGLEM